MSTIRSAALTAILAGGGCRADDGVPRADCLVCRKNGDLACVCVRIEADTPRCELGGTTYYFCSEDCRVEFLKNPARYSATLR